jgi:hypothetical protein
MTQQACYSLWLGYLLRFDNFFFETALLMTNIVFHTMEMKYILCKSLTMHVGEIGPIEVEFIIAFLLFFCGGWLGPDSLQLSLGQVIGIQNELIGSVKMKFVIGGLFLPL